MQGIRRAMAAWRSRGGGKAWRPKAMLNNERDGRAVWIFLGCSSAWGGGVFFGWNFLAYPSVGEIFLAGGFLSVFDCGEVF